MRAVAMFQGQLAAGVSPVQIWCDTFTVSSTTVISFENVFSVLANGMLSVCTLSGLCSPSETGALSPDSITIEGTISHTTSVPQPVHARGVPLLGAVLGVNAQAGVVVASTASLSVRQRPSPLIFTLQLERVIMPSDFAVVDGACLLLPPPFAVAG